MKKVKVTTDNQRVFTQDPKCRPGSGFTISQEVTAWLADGSRGGCSIESKKRHAWERALSTGWTPVNHVHSTFTFERDEDALLFKLTWGGSL